MGVPASPGQAAPRVAIHSIRFHLAARLIVPVGCVLVVWGLIAWLVLDGRLDRLRWLHWLNMTSPSHQVLVGVAMIVGAGLLVVVTVIIRLASFARRLAKEISSLTATAGTLAGEQLPRIVTALRNGEPVREEAAGPSPDMKVAEIAAADSAIAGLYRAAVAATVAEADLRNGFRQILVSLGRRNQSLLHRQLRIIDSLEQQATNPSALADLFALDHLTTRMRRHAESLAVVSGTSVGRSWSEPVLVIDVMRAATAEVEDYTRVSVVTDSEEAVTAAAATDMIHLLAELIENATLFSPSTTRVEVRAERVANGLAIEVEDRGLGIPSDQLIQINARLAHPPDFDLADADRLGLFVAGRLAARHGVHVALAQSAYRGTKAVVVLPDSIVVAPRETEADGRAAPGPVTGRTARTARTARLNLRAPEVLTLAGAGSRVEVLASTTIHGLPRRIRPDATPDAASGSSRDGGQPRADDSGGLPRRRQVPPDGPAPDHARALAASLQNSWHRSRADDQTPESTPDSEES